MIHFDSMGLDPSVVEAISELGYKEPTPVQEQAIPLLLSKDTDLVALAQTGTGKTAAFGLPLISKIDVNSKNTQALILSPTRELALQISKELKGFSKYVKGLNIATVYGGASIEGQRKELRSGAQIIVATPGRLLDMINRRYVQLQDAQYAILDEADEMLNMGFYEDIKSILTHTPKDKSSWLFSATMPKEVSTIAKKFMHDPIEITVGTKNSGAKNVNHQYFIVGARERYNALKAVIGMNPAIFGCVFCRTKIETQKVAEKLIHDGYKAAAIHGDLSQNQRDAVMQSFRKKKIQLLIATDVAARGIDVDDITHVVNYQLPDEIETYTHRSGRTGRAGKLGTSVLFVTKSDRRKIKLIENKLQTKLTELEIPKPEEVFQFKMTHWVEQIKTTPIKSDLHPYLSKVVQDLEGFSKEELIELFLSKEFQTFNFNAKPLEFTNESSSEGRPERTINASKDKDRFFINVGARDQYDWQNLKDFLRSFLKLDQDDVFQVEVMKNFSFFSTHNKHRDLVLKSFQDLVLDERKVNVELTKKGKTYSPKKQFSKGKNKRKSRF